MSPQESTLCAENHRKHTLSVMEKKNPAFASLSLSITLLPMKGAW